MRGWGMLPNANGIVVPYPKLNPAMLKYMSLWPQANGPELLVNGSLAAPLFLLTIPGRRFVKISEPCGRTISSAIGTRSQPPTPWMMGAA